MALCKNSCGVPLYKQVKEHVVTRILAGDWPQGQTLPSENQLTGELGVSRMTVHRALRELTSEGWLTRVQGAGTFVAESKPQSALMEIRNIREEIAERGHIHSCEVVLLTQEKANADIAHALGVGAGTSVYHSIFLHKEDKHPVQVENRYVNPAFAPKFLEQDFTRVTAFEYFGQLGPIDAAEHIIEAVLPNEMNRRLLRCRASEPCLLLTRRTWSNGLVVSRVRQMYPGSRYRLASRQEYNRATH
ncbi:MAG: histidine utilization repressor [Alphaproteobacteria bacterium]